MNINIKQFESQSLSSEVAEIFKNFKPKKELSQYLADSYKRLYLFGGMSSALEDTFNSRSERVAVCGSSLHFAKNIYPDGTIDDNAVLKNALFCRDRLCPMCQWRRSLLVFGQVQSIMDIIRPDYKFAMLTLTVPNVSAEALPLEIQNLLYNLNLFFKYKDIKKVVCGYYRALEITVNRVNRTFHPHFHIVLALPKGYSTFSSEWLSRDEWLSLWKQATKDESITQVDIRFIKNLEKAVAEVAKYTVKSNQYIFPEDPDLTDFCVFNLAKALHGVRLYGFGGIFRDVHKKLLMQDVESEGADLVGTQKSKLLKELPWLVSVYAWLKSDYLLEKSYIEPPEEHSVNQKLTE